MSSGRLVILSGPSGVGKDTVLDAWRLRNPRVERVVAATTRAPRTGEVHGEDYSFLSREEFLEKVSCSEMLEYKEVFGNLYGTPLDGLQRALSQGKIAILKIDVQGALDVMEKRPDALSIFLLPPDEDVLESRLRARSTEGDEEVRQRLETARREIEIGISRYANHVINADVAKTVDDLEAIVNG